MCKNNDKILLRTFNLIAIEQKRGQDVFYRMKNNEFTYVLKKLSMIDKTSENNIKVDKMWEKFLEIAIFCITKQHQKPVEILKGFISTKLSGKYKLTLQIEKSYASAYIRKNRLRKHKPTKEPTIWHENKAGHISAYPFSCALRAVASYNYLLVNGERRLTMREMLCLQGFPDSYQIAA